MPRSHVKVAGSLAAQQSHQPHFGEVAPRLSDLREGLSAMATEQRTTLLACQSVLHDAENPF